MPTSYKKRVSKEGESHAETGGVLLGIGIVIVVFWAMVRTDLLRGSQLNIVSWCILGIVLALLAGILLFLGHYLKQTYEKEYFVLLRSLGLLLLVLTTGGLTTYLWYDNKTKVEDGLILSTFLISIVISYLLVTGGTFIICRETFKEKGIERVASEIEEEF